MTEAKHYPNFHEEENNSSNQQYNQTVNKAVENQIPPPPRDYEQTLAQSPNMSLSVNGQQFLKSSANWSYFIGIIFIVFLILGSLGVIISMVSMLFVSNSMLLISIGSIIFSLLFLLLYYFPIIYLIKSSSKIKKGINTSSIQILEEGFLYKRKFWRFLGILTIIMLLFYVLTFIGLAIFSGGMMMMMDGFDFESIFNSFN